MDLLLRIYAQHCCLVCQAIITRSSLCICAADDMLGVYSAFKGSLLWHMERGLVRNLKQVLHAMNTAKQEPAVHSSSDRHQLPEPL